MYIILVQGKEGLIYIGLIFERLKVWGLCGVCVYINFGYYGIVVFKGVLVEEMEVVYMQIFGF